MRGRPRPSLPAAAAVGLLLVLVLAAAGRWGGNDGGLRGVSPRAWRAGRKSSVCECRLGEVLQDGACSPVSDVVSYFPPPSEVRGAECPGWAEQADRLGREIKGLQWDRCTATTFAPSLLPPHGFGSTFMYAAYGLARGLAAGKAFDVVPGSFRLFARDDCGGSFMCYFDPFSRCGEAAFKRWERAGRQRVNFKHTAYGGAKVAKRMTQNDKRKRPLQVPGAYEGAATMAWYHSELVAYLWRPKPEVRNMVEDIKRQIGYRHPIVGMHVRRGDACRDTERTPLSQCYELAAYMAHAQKMQDLYGVENIFLATDDPEVVREAEGKYRGFRFIYAPIDREWYDAQPKSAGAGPPPPPLPGLWRGGIEYRLDTGEGDPGKVGLEAVIDAELLGQADFFVGTLGSNLGRIAFELILSRKRRVVPFASLDIGWCASYSTKPGGFQLVTTADGRQEPFEC